MANFEFTETGIKGLVLISCKKYGDSRGYFMETYSRREFEANGLNIDFVQDNQSKSSKGTLRGLHFQRKHPQGKLVRVIEGAVYDVAVDLRKGSETYGNWYGVTLTDDNNRLFYVPEGFAHGFLTLSETAVFSYKCTDFYYPEYEDGIIWNDETLNIDWPLDGIGEVLLSEKDRRLGGLREKAGCSY